MKYLTLNHMEVFIFSDQISHDDMFRRVAFPPKDHCTGAGFIGEDWKPFGESESLGIGVGFMDESMIRATVKMGERRREKEVDSDVLQQMPL